MWPLQKATSWRDGLSCSDGWKPARRGRWRGGPRQLGPQQTFWVERSSRVLEDLHSRGECTRFLPRPQCERKGLGRERQTWGSGPGGAGPAPGEGACHTPPCSELQEATSELQLAKRRLSQAGLPEAESGVSPGGCPAGARPPRSSGHFQVSQPQLLLAAPCGLRCLLPPPTAPLGS